MRLTGALHPHQVSSLVAVDALVRRAAELGEPPITWELSTISGDTDTQRAVERVIAREGENREEMGREGFVDRTERFERDAVIDLHELLSELHIETTSVGSNVITDELRTAASVGFVRLFDAGLLRNTHAVIDTCPSCETVVDESDVETMTRESEQLCLQLESDLGELTICTTTPELLVGVAAIAVRPDHPCAWATVEMPISNATVPVISIADVDEPTFVIPGHDAWSHAVAKELRLPIVEVLDSSGTVRHSGALEGMARYAARAAAQQILEDADMVLASEAVEVTERVCRRCATALVPLHGTHWILAFRDLVGPVIEALESGAISFVPESARQRFLSWCDQLGDWCISQQLWSGLRIPVYTCVDCGQVTASVSDESSCKACMGTLKSHDDVLDARFVACIAPLVTIGWPHRASLDTEEEVTLFVDETSAKTWGIPVLAVGIKLMGTPPCHRIAVHRVIDAQEEVTALATTAYIDLAREHGARTARASLLYGDVDVERAEAVVSVIDEPTRGHIDLRDVATKVDDAVRSLDASVALDVLAQVASRGVLPNERDELERLAKPLLSDGDQ